MTLHMKSYAYEGNPLSSGHSTLSACLPLPQSHTRETCHCTKWYRLPQSAAQDTSAGPVTWRSFGFSNMN